MKIIRTMLIVSAIGLVNQGIAQKKLDIDFPLTGKIQTQNSCEIASSNFSVGGETMDRDLIKFDSWKEYLGPLGAKKIRLQAGWAKCEPSKNQYNFEWLDEIIDYVISQGVEPWLQVSYGNPVYEGGGGIHLSAGIPASKEALEGWDNWVKELAKRYSAKVKYWEIWNEPDNKGRTSCEDYADLYVRSAEIIRHSIPDAEMFALSLAYVDKRGEKYIDGFLNELKKQEKLHLVNDITVHGYTYNPDAVYSSYEKLFNVVKKYSDKIKLRQGELGCPSEFQGFMALGNNDWSELSQSKWVVRKMLGDLGRDIPSLYFLITDIVYTHDHEKLMPEPKRNTKGLIKSDIERNFVSLKPSYAAYQHVASTFDHSLKRIPNYPFTHNSNHSLSVFAYRSECFDKQIVTVWKDDEIPGDSNATTAVDFMFPAGNFQEPVLVDIRTGLIYNIPENNWKKKGTKYNFEDIPVYDSPILIADRSLIE
ncbi:MAG: beta-galactosidase [Kiritimatiellia bacterium]